MVLTGVALRHALVVERLQEPHVGGVQVAHQVDHRVGLASARRRGRGTRRRGPRCRATATRCPGCRSASSCAGSADGHCTSSRSTCSTGGALQVELQRPVDPVDRAAAAAARRRGDTSSPSATCPSTYQVTTRVHSPASVGAIASPTSALSSVDLPAFTLPAMATRSGSSNRSRLCCSQPSGLRAVAVDVDGAAQQHRADRRRAAGLRRIRADRGRRRARQRSGPRRRDCSIRASSALRSRIRRSRLGRRSSPRFCAAATEARSRCCTSSASAVKWSRSWRWVRRSMSRESLPTWKVTSSMCLRTAAWRRSAAALQHRASSRRARSCRRSSTRRRARAG